MKVPVLFPSLAIALMTAGILFAGDDQNPPKEKPAPAARPGVMVPVPNIKIPGVEWTAEQKDKIKELQKELAPKFFVAIQKMEAVLTDDQKKAQKEAVEAAKAAGKSRQEIAQAARAAVTLTDDQKKQQAEIQKEMKTAQKEFIQNVMGLLTPEQKQQMIEKQQGGKHEEKEDKE